MQDLQVELADAEAIGLDEPHDLESWSQVGSPAPRAWRQDHPMMNTRVEHDAMSIFDAVTT